MRKKAIIFISLLYVIQAYGQDNTIKTQAWKLMSYNGSLSLNGQYNTAFAGTDIKSDNYTYGGGLSLSTSSYVWHPNFLTLSISGNYSPQKGEFVSSSIPDYFTSLSSKQYNIYARFFKNLDYKINAYATHNEQKGEDRFFDRDITTKKWGANFSYIKDYDIRMNLEHLNNFQSNNLTTNEQTWGQTALIANIKKSYFKSDRNELNINIQRNTSEQKDLYKNSTDLAYINFRNFMFLNKKETIPLNSSVLYSKTRGNVDFTNMGFNESVRIPLGKQLNFDAQFGKYSIKRSSNLTNDTKFGSSLAYGLYKSLNTSISFNYGNTDREKSFVVESKRIIFNTEYSKSIPRIKGGISMRYNYSKQDFSNEIEANLLRIYNENHLLDDSSIVLLDNTNIIMETIEVKDITGSIIYQENTDYILVPAGDFIQIQRLIGGNIANNMEVYIDYDIIQNNSYAFNEDSGEFNFSLNCLNRFLTLNYINNYRTFDVEEGEFKNIGLDEYRKNTYEALFKYKQFQARASYEDKNSNVFPYKLYSYSLSTTGVINRKINYQFNAIVNNYTLFFIAGRTNKISTISSNFNYYISYRTQLNFNLSYSQQTGSIQNFNFISGRSELKTRYNQLEFSLGLNYYNRTIPIQDFSSQYIGTSINITRKF